MKKPRLPLVILSLALIVFVSGCTGGLDPQALATSNSMIQQFLDEHPNAKIVVTHFSAAESKNVIDQMRKDCDNPYIDEKELYRVTINDTATNFFAVVWIDWQNKTIECAYKYGSDGVIIEKPKPPGNCTAHAFFKCYKDNLYWFDSCGHVQDKKEYCQNGCAEGTSQSGESASKCLGECKSHSKYSCYGDNVYWFDNCGNVQDKKEYCNYGCENGFCKPAKENTCEKAGGYCTQIGTPVCGNGICESGEGVCPPCTPPSCPICNIQIDCPQDCTAAATSASGGGGGYSTTTGMIVAATSIQTTEAAVTTETTTATSKIVAYQCKSGYSAYPKYFCKEGGVCCIPSPSEFCGTSTYGACSSDDGCITGGCSGQVCQSKGDDPVITDCKYSDCYNSDNYGLKCKCITQPNIECSNPGSTRGTCESPKGCQWTKTACPADAKICPDGTTVGRTGPNCEFASCPITAKYYRNAYWTCYDGTQGKEGGESSCKSYADWKSYAEYSCKGKCITLSATETPTASGGGGGGSPTTTKCGVSSFNVFNECSPGTACTDSDGGKNYYVKGSTTGLAAEGKMTTDTDYCNGNTWLVEWFCSGDYRTNTNYECPYGCSDGACISQTIKCQSNSDCPTSTTRKYCSGSSACTETISYACTNPGTVNSYCSAASGGGCSSCPIGCLNGTCTEICTNGQTRSCGSNVGICRQGNQICTNGNWGTCTGSTGPTTEICGNGLDDDCDGQVDDGCQQPKTCGEMGYTCTSFSSGCGSMRQVDYLCGGFAQLNDSSTRSYHVVEGEIVKKGDYVIIAPSQNADYGRIFQYTAASNVGGQGGYIELKDVFVGDITRVYLTEGSYTSGTFTIEGSDFKAKADPSTLNAQFTWDAGSSYGNPGESVTVFPSIRGKNGEHIVLVKSIVLNPSGLVFYQFPGNNAIVISSSTTYLDAGRLRYEFKPYGQGVLLTAIKDSSGNVLANLLEAPAVLIQEESSRTISGSDVQDYIVATVADGSYTGTDVTILPPKITASTYYGFTVPSFSSVMRYYDRYGTYIIYDSSSQGQMNVYIPQAQAQAMVAIGSNPSFDVSGTSYSVTNGIDIANPSTRIYFGDSLTKPGLKTSITKLYLPTLLPDGVFYDASGTSYTYTQGINMRGGTVTFGTSGGDIDPVLYIDTGTSTTTPLYTEYVTFNRPLNPGSQDVIGQEITAFGKSYIIGSGSAYDSVTKKLVLFGSSNTQVITENQTVEMSIGGITHLVRVVGVSSSTVAVISVDGVSMSVTKGNMYTIAGMDVYMSDVYYFTQSGQLSQVKIMLGASKITLENGNAVRVGQSEDTIDGTLVTLTGTLGQGITKLEIAVTGKDSSSDYLIPGMAFTDPVFGTFKLAFNGLLSGSTDTVMIDNAGTTGANLRFTDYRGNEKTIFWAYSSVMPSGGLCCAP